MDKDELVRIKNELIMSEKLIEQELEPIMRENVARYTGRWIPEIAFDWDIVLNEVYPIVQSYLPSLFYRNPRAFLKPKTKTYIAKKRNPITGDMEEVFMDSDKSAKTQEHILNYCIEEIYYKKECQKTLMDALIFPYGVLWHGYKGNFGMTEEQSYFIKKDQVFVTRLSPKEFLFDPSVNLANLDKARWQARKFSVPLEDIVDDDKLDVSKQLQGKLGFGQKVGYSNYKETLARGGGDVLKANANIKSLIDYTEDQYRKSACSHFIDVYEIFMRPSKKEMREGSKGKIILYTPEQEKPLRESKWVIKAEGWPGQVLEFSPLNDSSFGLSDVETYKNIIDQKNMIINLQLRNAEQTGKTYIGVSKEAANEEDIERLVQGQNTIVQFDNGDPRQKMFVASASAGASQELYILDQRIDKNLQDKSGITDLRKGFLQSGEESATSVKLRAAGGNVRSLYRQDIMADFLKMSFKYINQLNRQFMPYDKAVRVVGSLDLDWSEDPTEETVQAEVDIDMDVNSMLPEDPEKEIQELTTVLNLEMQAVTNPPFMQKLGQEGYTFNFKPIIENLLMRLKIRNPEVFRKIKPEESQGFVMVAELRAAEANVNSALTGMDAQGQPIRDLAQLPSPPQAGQDHRARIETYASIQSLLQKMNQVSDILNMLIQMQAQLLEEEQKKESPQPGSPVDLKKGINEVGSV